MSAAATGPDPVIHMTEALIISSDARLVPVPHGALQLDSDSVIVLICHDIQTIFLWRGREAGLFKRLMGTRAIARLSHTYPEYRIRPVDEGAEPEDFRRRFGRPA